jgi:hypothetical protein
MASYRVQVWDFDTDFSTKNLIAEFENPKNLGYGSYLNDIGEAFFTISQRDAKANIRASEGKAHLFIIRYGEGNEDVVWRGIMGEHDAIDDDVIFYAYGYEHYFFSLHTGWKKKWRQTQIAGAAGRPIEYLWDRAQTVNDSPMQWMSTGTIESPWTTDSQSTALVLNRYQVNWKPIHKALKELTAIATSDTRNTCFYEIDFPKDPSDHSATFNFWRDNSTDQNDLRLEYPNNILDWSDPYTPVLKRNKTFGVGSGPRGQLYRYQWGQGKSPFGRFAFGMHSQNMYLSWVRDRAELGRIVKRRTQLGLREDTDIWVRCQPGTVPPWRSTAASWHLGDTVWVKINHGATNISKRMYLMGEQTVFVKGVEYVQPLLEDRYGKFSSTFNGWEWFGATDSNPATGDPGTAWRYRPPGASVTYTVRHNVTFPEDTQIAVLCWVGFDQSWFLPSGFSNVSLNGVAGTIAYHYDASASGQDYIQWMWSGADVPSGQTVELAMDASWHYWDSDAWTAYGLAYAGSGADTPAVLDTNTHASSNPIIGTSDSGSTSGMSLFSFAHRMSNLPAGRAVTGPGEIICDFTSIQGGDNYFCVTGSQQANTGEQSWSLAAGQNPAFGGIGQVVMYSNAESL